MSIELGKFNQLEVVKEVDFGVYLDGGDEGEILLPTRRSSDLVGAGRSVCLSGSLLGESIRSFPELGIDERPVCAVP